MVVYHAGLLAVAVCNNDLETILCKIGDGLCRQLNIGFLFRKSFTERTAPGSDNDFFIHGNPPLLY